MSGELGAYTFLPWLRRGIANTITQVDGAVVPGARATVPVDLQVTGTGASSGPVSANVHRDVALFGPGDIIGLDPRSIVRMEPRPGITDFEPNYLAAIEFYDEDLPWRYTPAAPDAATGRLRPWLSLIVLAEGEFDDVGATAPGAQMPSVTVSDLTLFPPAEQLWAWGHVHVNADLAQTASEIVPADLAATMTRFETQVSANPDIASSRLICPRKLLPNTGYHAFVMPSFEAGRLAGLGMVPGGAPKPTTSAWEAYQGRPDGGRFVYYHRWYFRTGVVGDFEYLVKLLKPQPVHPKVGQRDMDVQTPGSNLPAAVDASFAGVLRLGGALRAPQSSLNPAEVAEAKRFDQWDKPRPTPFQTQLAALVNLGADLESGDASDPDPVISPPLYGQWHSLTERLLDPTPLPPAHNENWVHDLNLDPRFRAAAGFGTEVVRKNQEDYMAAAWSQIGAVLEANRRIRLAHLAKAVAVRWHQRYLEPKLATDPGKLLSVLAPALSRVVVGDLTARHQAMTSTTGLAPLSVGLRRMARPGSHIVRRLSRMKLKQPLRGNLLERMERGEVTAARPKAAPEGAAVMADIAKQIRPFLARAKLTDRLVFFDDTASHDKAIDTLPKNPRFVVDGYKKQPGFDPGGEDSKEGKRFKDALKDNDALVGATIKVSEEPVRRPLRLHDLAAGSLERLNPARTIPKRALAGLKIPQRLHFLVFEQFKEAMAYPEIDVPMYKPLVDKSDEMFVPNINLVEPNSITLVETNQRFIESYMVGLNHEFARELLWREYPTDQRGSYFRQFWDATGAMPVAGETADQRRERLRDIPPLHLWSRASELGAHDHRETTPGTEEEEVVLVIRGDLLKRYPTAVIYAQRADWKRKPDGSIDRNAERLLVDAPPGEAYPPPPTRIKLPLYEAKVDPDIYFFGFDLTVPAARGGSGENPTDDAGWFFVIQERPGEPRFGFDVEREGQLNIWNDLAWADVLPAGSQFVPVGNQTVPRALTQPTAPSVAEKDIQWKDDKAVAWNAAMQSSDVAYITYQAPMQVAVHAREMLRG